jgi:hypothetical protein
MIHPDLKRLAKIVAEWAEKLPLKKVLFLGAAFAGTLQPVVTSM